MDYTDNITANKKEEMDIKANKQEETTMERLERQNQATYS